MKRILFALLLAVPSTALARDVSRISSDVTAELLADADGLAVPATMSAQNHDLQRFYNQAKLGLNVTWGTSTAFVATCEEAPESAGPWTLMASCTQNTNFDCKPRTWAFTKADWPLGQINMRIPVTDRAYRCQFWDAALGTGSITVTGSKTRQ